MILIVCLDDHGGMMFNHRRQSQDRIVREKIMRLVKDQTLWMNSYSYKQFEQDLCYKEQLTCIIQDEHFANKAGQGDYCFVEDPDVENYCEYAQKLIVFQWNRIYPSDQNFNMKELKNDWKKTESSDFAGHSHEKITMEVYER